MKTANPQENFLTALKNGKIGPFRSNSTPASIQERFKEKIPFEWNEDNWLITDGLEAIFSKESIWFLSQVRFKFDHSGQMHSWHKHFQLQWMLWLEQPNYISLKIILQESGLEFRSLVFTDDTRGILLRKYPATMLINFSVDNLPASLLLNFRGDLQSLFLVKSLETHN